MADLRSYYQDPSFEMQMRRSKFLNNDITKLRPHQPHHKMMINNNYQPQNWPVASRSVAYSTRPKKSNLLYNLLNARSNENHEHQMNMDYYNSINCRPDFSSQMPPPRSSHLKGDTSLDLLHPYYRQRSQSMGSQTGWGYIRDAACSRTSSYESLVSYESISDESLPQNRSPNSQSEMLLEVTRQKLMKLFTNSGERNAAASSPDFNEGEMHSLSQPGSPPKNGTIFESRRKYSEGNHGMHAKAAQNARARYAEILPVDLSCKRKKSLGAIHSLKRKDSEVDEGYDESILKSVLTGRGRSNSLSVFEMNRLRLANQRNSTVPDMLNMGNLLGRPSNKQRVALAKKNLAPVAAHITDWLQKIIEFAKSQPDFNKLSDDDRLTLLSAAIPRLLLLDMAETNFQFAVASVREPVTCPGSEASTIEQKNGSSQSLVEEQKEDNNIPTNQFVENLQNIIKRCQTLNISSEEYICLKLVMLFQSGKLWLFTTGTIVLNYQLQFLTLDLTRNLQPVNWITSPSRTENQVTI